MSKQPPRKKRVSTNKPRRDDNTSTNQNAPKTNSENQSIAKAIPFYIMALGNFSVALWLLWQITQAKGDLAGIWVLLCLFGSAVFLVPSIVAASLTWGIAKSKRYGTRLLLALGVTLVPWLLSAIFYFMTK